MDGGSFFDEPGGVATDDLVRRDILHHNRAGRHDGALADCHPRPDEGLCGNPGAGADGDRRFEQRKIGAGVIVRAGTQMRILADDRPRADVNRPERIKYRAIADNGIVIDLQVPGDFDVSARADGNVVADLRAEASQKPSAKAVPVVKTCAEDRGLCIHPEDAHDLLPGGPGTDAKRHLVGFFRCSLSHETVVCRKSGEKQARGGQATEVAGRSA